MQQTEAYFHLIGDISGLVLVLQAGKGQADLRFL
jgi:hypothetical protein